MEKGQVVRHNKSGKLYAVVTNRDGWVGYIGVRNGKNYGPIRGASDSQVGQNFTLAPGLQAIFSGYSWNFKVIGSESEAVTLTPAVEDR